MSLQFQTAALLQIEAEPAKSRDKWVILYLGPGSTSAVSRARCRLNLRLVLAPQPTLEELFPQVMIVKVL